MADFVGAVDQGTTSSRFMIFDHDGNEVAKHQLEHTQYLPRPGWVEHDPVEIWERTNVAIQNAVRTAGISATDLAALGITNQRETTVVWDPRNGRPYCNAIVWQDTRTDSIAKALESVRVSCHTMALQYGRPLRGSHTTVVSRWLVMPIAARSVAAMPAVRTAFWMATLVRSQISTGSCSTQPGRGRYWVCSSWCLATSLPSWSKIMKRLLVVPWSTAPTKSAMATAFRGVRSWGAGADQDASGAGVRPGGSGSEDGRQRPMKSL